MEAIVKQVELDLTSRKPPKAPNGNGFTEIPKGKSYRDQKGYVKMNVSHIPNLHMSVKFLVRISNNGRTKIFHKKKIGSLNLKVHML